LGDVPDSLRESEKLIQAPQQQEPTLQKLQLVPDGTDKGAFSSIDFLFRHLQVGLALTAPFPLLLHLAISKEQVFNPTLLAEVLFSRNPRSKGFNVERIDGERCRALTLHLESDALEAFKEEEEKLLLRYSKETVEAAGRTKVEIWNGRDELDVCC